MTRVAEHYRRWPFPAVEHGSREGLILLRTLDSWLKDRADTSRVIDVGCGTGHTVIALASHFQETEFVGIDFVEENLASAESLARDAGVDNVSFMRVDLEDGVPDDLGRFDIALCMGVLHHLADIGAGFERFCSLLETDGKLVLWLYGKHGRGRHEKNQRLLRMLGEGLEDESRLTLAQAFVSELGERFAADTGFYTPRGSGPEGLAFLLKHPSWLADQMIPARERAVTLEEILELFDGHDMAFEKWLGVDIDPRSYTGHPLVLARFGSLSARQRLLAIDLLLKPAYYFVAAKRRSAGR